MRKRQLISSQVSGFKDDQDELSAARLEAESERIQALADALLAESEAPTEVSMYPVDSEISGVFAHPTTGPSGAQVSYFYRFTNVKVSEGGIDVFAGPSRKQPKSYAFDVVLVNSTSPQPPTSLVLQPTEIGTIEQYVHLDVVPAMQAAYAMHP